MAPGSQSISDTGAVAHPIRFKDGAWIAPLFTFILSVSLLVPYPNALPAGIIALILAIVTASKRATIDDGETTSVIAELALLLIAFMLFTMPDGRMTQGIFVVGNSGILAFYLFLWITRKAWEPFVATVTFSGCMALLTFGKPTELLALLPLLVMPIVSIATLVSAYIHGLRPGMKIAPTD